jgi:hypothetical protein
MNEGKEKNFSRRLIVVAHAVAILVGLIYGYDFGSRVGGMPVGVIVAVIAALFCTLLIGSLESMLVERKPPSKSRRGNATHAQKPADDGQGERTS